MKQDSNTSVEIKRPHGIARQNHDVIAFDLVMLTTSKYGQKVKSIFPAGTPIKEVNAFFRLTGNLKFTRN